MLIFTEARMISEIVTVSQLLSSRLPKKYNEKSKAKRKRSKPIYNSDC